MRVYMYVLFDILVPFSTFMTRWFGERVNKEFLLENGALYTSFFDRPEYEDAGPTTNWNKMRKLLRPAHWGDDDDEYFVHDFRWFNESYFLSFFIVWSSLCIFLYFSFSVFSSYCCNMTVKNYHHHYR